VRQKDQDLEKLNKQVTEVNQLIKNKDHNLDELNQEVIQLRNQIDQKGSEIVELNKMIRDKTSDLISLRDELTEIHNSILFNFIQKITRRIDSNFPSGTRRGEVKKISKESLQMIKRKGFKQYISAVKTQVKKREFYIPIPMKITQDQKRLLIEVVQNNKKTRLKLKQHSKNEINRDEIEIQDEDELI